MSRSFTLPGGRKMIGEIIGQPLELSQQQAWEWQAWRRGSEGGSTVEGVPQAHAGLVLVHLTRREAAAPAPSVDPEAFAAKVRANLQRRRRTRFADLAHVAASLLQRVLCSSGLRVWT